MSDPAAAHRAASRATPAQRWTRSIACVAMLVPYLVGERVEAFGLKTHLWVAQQVHGDVVDDCHVTLLERSYAIDPGDCQALRSQPGAFFAGVLGPDLYPDVVTGQTTTHPGVDGGWGTAEFQSHLLGRAVNEEQRAFAVGYLLHGAADAMAHTYVNHYAGDVFNLKDERAVELRHIAIEKYIDDALPPGELPGFGAPPHFVRDQLIHDASVAAQHQRSGIALHTAAMAQVRDAVDGMVSDAGRLDAAVAKLLREYTKLHLDAQGQLASGEAELAAAEALAVAKQRELAAKQQALDTAIRALVQAAAAVDENLAAIDELTTQAEMKRELNRRLLGVAVDLQRQLDVLNSERTAALSAVEDLVAQVASAVCEEGKLGQCSELWCKLNLLCLQTCESVREACRHRQALIDALASARQVLEDVDGRVTAARASWLDTLHEAALALDAAQSLLQQRARLESQRAALDVTVGTARAARDRQQQQWEVEQTAYAAAQAEVAKARREVGRLRSQALDAASVANAVQSVYTELGLVAKAFEYWREGIDQAGTAFVRTSDAVGQAMVADADGVFRLYVDWLSCHGGTYMAEPYHLAQAPCHLESEFEKAQASLENLVVSVLPPPLSQLHAEITALKLRFTAEVERAVRRATIDLVAWAGDESMARLIDVIGHPMAGTEVFLAEELQGGRQPGDKALLMFPDGLGMVQRDIGLRDGRLTPERFPALQGALVLSRVALLRQTGWEALIAEAGGPQALAQFRALAPDTSRSILLHSLRSIDGNHAWQPYGLPYPRSEGTAEPVAADRRRFGYGAAGDEQQGFWLFMDPTLRTSVFLKLFPESVHGEIALHPSMQAPAYPFAICAANPFPVTFTAERGPAIRDPGCQ